MLSTKNSIDIGVELGTIQKYLDNIEKQVNEDLKVLNVRRSIPHGISPDYGRNEINLKLNFDEVNIADWDSLMKKLKDKFVQYRELRERQWALHKELDINKVKEVASIAGQATPLLDLNY